MDKKKREVINIRTRQTEYEYREESKYAERCMVADVASWPTAKQMHLDQSQYDAIKLALTNRLALIQG